MLKLTTHDLLPSSRRGWGEAKNAPVNTQPATTHKLLSFTCEWPEYYEFQYLWVVTGAFWASPQPLRRRGAVGGGFAERIARFGFAQRALLSAVVTSGYKLKPFGSPHTQAAPLLREGLGEAKNAPVNVCRPQPAKYIYSPANGRNIMNFNTYWW